MFTDRNMTEHNRCSTHIQHEHIPWEKAGDKMSDQQIMGSVLVQIWLMPGRNMT